MSWKKSCGLMLVTSLLLGVSPAMSLVIEPPPEWLNPGRLYSDSVVMTERSPAVGLSTTRFWDDVDSHLEEHRVDQGMGGASPSLSEGGPVWSLPPTIESGERYLIVAPLQDFYPTGTPQLVALDPGELGEQLFEPEFSSWFRGPEESDAVLCCDAWRDEIAGLRETLSTEEFEQLLPSGDYDNCLRVSDARLYISLDLDQTSRSGKATPFEYEVTVPEWHSGEVALESERDLFLPWDGGSYWMSLDARWPGRAESCLEVRRTDLRDLSVDEYQICPTDLADRFPKISRADAVLPPIELPSVLECSRTESFSVDSDGERVEFSESNWCSLYRPQCEVLENALGAGRFVHSEEVEAACEPCSAYYQIAWDEEPAVKEPSHRQDSGGCVSVGSTGGQGSSGWPLALISFGFAMAAWRRRRVIN